MFNNNRQAQKVGVTGLFCTAKSYKTSLITQYLIKMLILPTI